MKDHKWIRIAADGSARRRSFAITSLGRAVLAAELHRLEELLAQARPALAEGETG
jgi:DNA-binding PadR family transcriptional regulator